MDQTAGERFRLGRLVGRSFAIWGRELPLLLALALSVHAPRVACQEGLARAWPYPILPTPGPDLPAAERARFGDLVGAWALKCIPIKLTRSLLWGLFVDLSLALVIFAVYARLRGRHAGFAECVRGGLRRLLPVLRVSVCLSILRAAYWAAWLLLFRLLLRSPLADLPILTFTILSPVLVHVLLSPFWVAVPAAAVAAEPRGLLRGSWRLTRGHRLAVCAILLLLYGIDWGSTRLIRMGLESAELPWLARKAIWWTQDLLVVSFTAVFAAVGYHALRLEKDGVDVSDLREVFA